MSSVTYLPNPADWSNEEIALMRRALNLAQMGEFTARPNPMVGCILIDHRYEIIAEGWHQKSGRGHAEVNALAAAGDKARDCIAFVTLEPCAHQGKTGPCAKALIKAGVSKVVAAMEDPNPEVSGKGFQLLKAAGIVVEYGCLEKEARALNPGFISRIMRNRPWVTVKLAMSLDGRTALADGASKWITGSESRENVQKLRARQDAIITGIGTLCADNPSMNVRAESVWFDNVKALGFEQPKRILLDRNARADRSSNFFAPTSEVYWFVGEHLKNEFEHNAELGHIKVRAYPSSLDALLAELAKENIGNVLVEAGHRLAGAFLAEDLIDELVVYIAPKLMGTTAMGLFELDVQNMTQTPQFKLDNVKQFGEDIRLTYRR